MRFNGAAINASRLNTAGALFPELLAGDSVGVVASELSGVRQKSLAGDLIVPVTGALDAAISQFFEGGLTSLFSSDISLSAVRIGSGEGLVQSAGSLYYSRLIYANGEALTSFIAVSDVGVVYGDGAGVISQLAILDGARRRPGAGDGTLTTFGGLTPSAIRVPWTTADVPLLPWVGELDTATVLAGGVKRKDGSGSAVASFSLVDGGMNRQVFIGSLDVEPQATGSATAIRTSPASEAVVVATAEADFEAKRTAAGDAVAVFSASMNGSVLVLGDMLGIVDVASHFDGNVFRMSGVMAASAEVDANLDGLRGKIGGASAVVSSFAEGDGTRGVVGELTPMALLLNAESFATDYNMGGLDDDDELFFRPSVVREFVRPAHTRELRRA